MKVVNAIITDYIIIEGCAILYARTGDNCTMSFTLKRKSDFFETLDINGHSTVDSYVRLKIEDGCIENVGHILYDKWIY